MARNAFRKLPDLFHDEIPNDEHEYIQIYGRYNNERVYKWEKEIEKWFDITKYFDADISNLIKK